MKFPLTILTTALSLLVISPAVPAHQQYDANGRPINDHQHVWRQQSYGQDYRQGHAVNGQQGNIVIWSPQTYQGYNAGSTVRFARPQAITQPPTTQGQTPAIKSVPRNEYGKGKSTSATAVRRGDRQ